jgi:hypothetical protein
MPNQLNAKDVLNVEFLKAAAHRSRDLAYTTDPSTAVDIFAHDFIEASDVQDQNEILLSLLQRMTYGHSAQTNERVVNYVAEKLMSNRKALREFAKQGGINL